ncbi:phytanoyl-CoA dioxygenase family protein, partial [bacterium]|nr:phytanoyl-CoA dioxygenase family protein [bacterium]
MEKSFAEFQENGFVRIPGFYTPQELEPIQRGIYDLIGVLARKYNLPLNREAFEPDCFDAGYN